MLLAGDEIGHTQTGQQQRLLPGQRNLLARLEPDARAEKSLLQFVRRVTAFYRSSSRSFIAAASSTDKAIHGAEAPEIAWLDPIGQRNDATRPGTSRSCAAWECSSSAEDIDVDEHGEKIDGDTILLLFNADHQNAIDFHLPPTERGLPWELLIDTFRDDNADSPRAIEGTFKLMPCSAAAFRSRTPMEKTAATVL